MLIAKLIHYYLLYSFVTLNRECFEKIYKHERNIKTKERMLLLLNVVYLGKISAHMYLETFIEVKHRSKAWACEWLKRYDKEGINGLKTIPKSGTDHPRDI